MAVSNAAHALGRRGDRGLNSPYVGLAAAPT
jgi:hypothetical protein